MKNNIQIAIDGPAAAGKSTIAKLAAEELGYTYIDTGAMYRAITYKAIERDIDLENEEALTQLLLETKIDLRPSVNGQLVFLDGEDVSDAIRSNIVTSSVSAVAAHATLREEMVKRQLKMAESGGVVMDGRDIGTHVLVDAELKIFMSASVDERAKRRQLDNERRGIDSHVEQLKKEIAERDKMDSERQASPLVQAKDAIYLDTTELSIMEAAQHIIQLAKERMS
ncbi:(d)CMP kinase [Paenisporosarcina quisquiliarum]|uniref:Cytidylate kinase n=1 Tax=Paenisporosarcina quisquiliarum TaxID=365346 RepID=A0A9X3LG73_9BACL|nr:(d)CMP kinase [Paenisporosarcina quisquiliarum]MCZ8535764.1 (d)CMP kinase [Paenisporosarcina quisquiliarum]